MTVIKCRGVWKVDGNKDIKIFKPLLGNGKGRKPEAVHHRTIVRIAARKAGERTAARTLVVSDKGRQYLKDLEAENG